MNSTYQNLLDKYLTQPGSYEGSPGFAFARDQGLQAAQRSTSRMRNSGNALAELTKLGTGYAAQDYGNTRDFLGRMTGQEQQYGLGQEANRLTGIRDANSFTLGNRGLDVQREGLGIGRENNWLNYALGVGRNANDLRRGDQSYGLGLLGADNDRSRIGNEAQNNWWNANNAAQRTANDYNLGAGRNATDWFNANTNRGAARSNDYWRRQQREPIESWNGGSYSQRWV